MRLRFLKFAMLGVTLIPALASAGSFNNAALFDDPRVLIAPGDARYSGVGGLVASGGGSSFCTGALVAANIVLTAGHCFEGVTAGAAFRVTTGSGGPQQRAITGFVLHPDYAGVQGGGDIRLLRLAGGFSGAETYGLYDADDELGQVFEKVGFGTLGTGRDGTQGPDDDGKRIIRNRYESDYGTISDTAIALQPAIAGLVRREVGFGLVSATLAYDFDGPLAAQDVFGRYLATPDTGLGDLESISARGDSGGPSFLIRDGVPLIAGITSLSQSGGIFAYEDVLPPFGIFRPGCGDAPRTVDASCAPSSWGDFGADTRVSLYAGFIDGVLGGTIGFTPLGTGGPAIPEPASWALMLTGFGIAGTMARRHRQKLIAAT